MPTNLEKYITAEFSNFIKSDPEMVDIGADYFGEWLTNEVNDHVGCCLDMQTLMATEFGHNDVKDNKDVLQGRLDYWQGPISDAEDKETRTMQINALLFLLDNLQ